MGNVPSRPAAEHRHNHDLASGFVQIFLVIVRQMNHPRPSGADGAATRPLPEFDFDAPDEESMHFLEEQWLRFCRSAGIEGEIPDIRAIIAAERTTPVSRRAAVESAR